MLAAGSDPIATAARIDVKRPLLSIQIGRPRTYVWNGSQDGAAATWTTAFRKEPVAGVVAVSRSGLAGDAVADTRAHGGLDKAVLAYAAGHYADWQAEWASDALPGGGFGENLTVAGLDESSVCLGDRWRIGDVVFEVSQPRQPCWKLGRRWNRPELPKRVIATGRTGWYLRVRQAGSIAAGMVVQIEVRPYPEWTIARANGVMYSKGGGGDELRALAELPVLAASWREPLMARAGRPDF